MFGICKQQSPVGVGHQRYEMLVHHLTSNGSIVEISLQFFRLETNDERVQFVYDLLQQNEFLHLLPALIEDRKCNETARRLREEGNAHFRFKRYERAFECYVESLSNAENDSENLALAYANRSAVLFEQELYGDCLKDIERALNAKYPDHLKPKLYTRREKCLALKPKAMKIRFHHPIPEIPAEQRNRSIQCATNAIEIASDAQNGRHVVATRDIRAGEVLAVEKFFCSVLLQKFYNHCHECLQLCYNLIPCPNCTLTMYCGELCKTQAYCYHQYECRILKSLLLLDEDRLDLLPLKLVLSIKDSFGQVGDIDDRSSDSVYRSDRYDEIHRLEGHTSRRSPSDLFRRAVTAAFMYHLVKNYTDFLQTDREHEVFKELLLKHMQISGINCQQIGEMAKNQFGVYTMAELASGVGSLGSLLSHSCWPNITKDAYGSTLVTRAICSIKKGEQCYVPYGPQYSEMPRRDRLETLKRRYFFDCKCRACEEDWPLYRGVYSNFPGVNEEKLLNGDARYAMEILPRLLECLEKLDENARQEYKLVIVETAKQCFSLFGNMRILF